MKTKESKLLYFIIILISIYNLGCLNKADKTEDISLQNSVSTQGGTFYYYYGSKLKAKIDYAVNVFSENGKIDITSGADNLFGIGNEIDALKFSSDFSNSYSMFVTYYPLQSQLDKLLTGEVFKVFKDGSSIVTQNGSNDISFLTSGNGVYSIVKTTEFKVNNFILVNLKKLSINFTNDIDASTVTKSGITFTPALSISSTKVSGKELVINLDSDISTDTVYKIVFSNLKDKSGVLSEYAYYGYELNVPDIVKNQEQWSIKVSGVNVLSKRTSSSYAAVSEDADVNNDVVGEFDKELPPLPPFGSYFRLYFVHSDELNYFQRDTKNINFTETAWTFYQEFSQLSGESYYIWWEFQDIPSEYDVKLIDVSGVIDGNPEKEFNMKNFSGFNYKVVTDNDKNKFKIVVRK